jgi:hypothetical protein
MKLVSLSVLITMASIACGGDVDPLGAAHANDTHPNGIYGAWVREDDPHLELHLAENGRYAFLPGAEANAMDRGTFVLSGHRIDWTHDDGSHGYDGDTNMWQLSRDARGDLLELQGMEDDMTPYGSRWRRK